VGIGDELMVTGMVREAQARDPRKVLIMYEKGKPRWCALWDNNPRIARHGQLGDFQTLRPRSDYLRPYCSEKTPERWTWKPCRPPIGEIYFRAHEQEFGNLNAGRIVFAHTLKHGASPNKRWHGWDRLARMMARHGDLVQMGTQESEPLAGVRFVQTTIRQAAAVVARARLVICSEGAMHHIAAAVGTPAVVIFGGYISPEVTGYDGQVSFFRGGGLGCGMRVPCEHCAAAMESITPEEVYEAAVRLL
jgi:ADP-heptose:LPS heptosyltransferase